MHAMGCWYFLAQRGCIKCENLFQQRERDILIVSTYWERETDSEQEIGRETEEDKIAVMKRARVSARKKRTLGTKGSNENGITNTSSSFYKNNNTTIGKTDKYIGRKKSIWKE